MSTWEASEMAISQSLARIEAAVERLDASVSALQQTVAEQRGKAHMMSVWISFVMSAIVATLVKKIWK